MNKSKQKIIKKNSKMIEIKVLYDMDSGKGI